MEKVFADLVQNCNLQHIAQNDFRKDRSCNTQLLEVINDFQMMANLG